MRRALTPPTTVAAALLLALAGCGGSGARQDAAGTTTGALTATQPAPPARGATPPGRPSPYDPPARVPRSGSGTLADPAQVAVVRTWVDRLRAGDVAGAAATFADGARIQNGTEVVVLRTRRARRAYMAEAFPCGARITDAEDAARGFVLVGFRIVARPGGLGSGSCGSGAVAVAAVRVARGRIREWYRLPDAPVASPDGSIS